MTITGYKFFNLKVYNSSKCIDYDPYFFLSVCVLEFGIMSIATNSIWCCINLLKRTEYNTIDKKYKLVKGDS